MITNLSNIDDSTNSSICLLVLSLITMIKHISFTAKLYSGFDMNNSRFYILESLHKGSSTFCLVLFSLEVFILLFYACWILYFLNEIVFLRRKVRGLLHRGPTFETNHLLYKYRGDYYTYILVAIIALLEPISLIPAMLSPLPMSEYFSFVDHFIPFKLASDFRMMTYVLGYILLCIINLLTAHLIRVCKSDTRIQLLPPIHNRLAILTLFILLLMLIKLLIEGVGNIIIELLVSLFISHELFRFYKNSKQLYYLLKWRYEDMRYEANYPLYRAHRRIALRYKYVTMYLIFGLFVQNISSWVGTTFNILSALLLYPIVPIHIPTSVIFPFTILKWLTIGLMILGSAPQFLLIVVSLYYVTVMCYSKLVSGFSRNRVRYFHEPILQQ